VISIVQLVSTSSTSNLTIATISMTVTLSRRGSSRSRGVSRVLAHDLSTPRGAVARWAPRIAVPWQTNSGPFVGRASAFLESAARRSLAHPRLWIYSRDTSTAG